jgi:hypothetical protein
MERPGVFLVSSIFWLRDESLEEFDNLPMFDEDLEAALEQFRESSRIYLGAGVPTEKRLIEER